METFPILIRKDGMPIRYLVVDDSVFARKNVAKMVEAFGGEIVGEAGDGCTAITEYDRTTPDMVLMDITMPQMEGIEAAERIVRSHPECPHRDGLFRRLSGKHCCGAAKRRASLCPEAGKVGNPLRSHQVRNGR